MDIKQINEDFLEFLEVPFRQSQKFEYRRQSRTVKTLGNRNLVAGTYQKRPHRLRHRIRSKSQYAGRTGNSSILPLSGALSG